VKNNQDELLLNEIDAAFFKNKFILHNQMIDNKGSTVYHDIDDGSLKIQSNKVTDLPYKINNEGFRCDNFDKNLTTELLFAGCSETFGYGGLLEDCWAYMANNELSLKNYFNLSQPGVGYQVIIYNILSYIKEYGIPKSLFILFPNIEREVIYDYPLIVNYKQNQYRIDKNGLETYYSATLHPLSSDQTPKMKKGLIDNKNTYKKKLFYFYQNITMFEQIMNLYNISYSWTCSVEVDRYNIKKITKFNNFIDYSSEDFYRYIYKYREEHKDIPMFKFDGHSGIAQHVFWKDLFLNGINL
jgi:hypothetical protein